MWGCYLKRDFAAVDIILTTMAYVGFMEGYVLWREQVYGKAYFRAIAGAVIGSWGLLGMTSRGV